MEIFILFLFFFLLDILKIKGNKVTYRIKVLWINNLCGYLSAKQKGTVTFYLVTKMRFLVSVTLLPFFML
jgi:hypothetical protein